MSVNQSVCQSRYQLYLAKILLVLYEHIFVSSAYSARVRRIISSHWLISDDIRQWDDVFYDGLRTAGLPMPIGIFLELAIIL